jgi:hypothetical protein
MDRRPGTPEAIKKGAMNNAPFLLNGGDPPQAETRDLPAFHAGRSNQN